MADNPPEPDPKEGEKAAEHPTTMKFCNKCTFQTVSLADMRAHNRLHLTTEEAAEDNPEVTAEDKTKDMKDKKEVSEKQVSALYSCISYLLYTSISNSNYTLSSISYHLLLGY